MKHILHLLPLPLSACLVLLTACVSPPAARLIPVDDAEAEAIGQMATGKLMTSLQSQLKAGIEAGGAAAGLKICATAAAPLTTAAGDTHAAVRSLRRTSERVRNPANEADALDQLALAQFRSEERKTPLLVRGADPKQELVYYSPIYMKPLCLNCHGTEQDLAPGVGDLLDSLYPQDRARDYRAGDFRGLIRVDLDPSSL